MSDCGCFLANHHSILLEAIGREREGENKTKPKFQRGTSLVGLGQSFVFAEVGMPHAFLMSGVQRMVCYWARLTPLLCAVILQAVAL